MKKRKLLTITFEKIIGNNAQNIVLYQLLKKRKYNISHNSIPNKKGHNNFVINHPYKAWYLIKENSEYIGSVYISKNNCIGISLLIYKPPFLLQTLNFVFKNHKPLRAIKSVRPPNFYINISPENKKMKYELEALGAEKIQITYTLKNLFIKLNSKDK